LYPERIHRTDGRDQDTREDKAAENQRAGFHTNQAPVMPSGIKILLFSPADDRLKNRTTGSRTKK
jgi:hypothetical protein